MSGDLALPQLPELADLERPLDGYIRVSRVGDRSGASYISPDVQRRALERWAEGHDVELVIHEPEENVSGGTMDRPVFNEVMRRIRAGESGGIVFYTLDRFSRDLGDGMRTLLEITDRGCIFASATEALYDPTTANGRLALQFNLMLAEYYRSRSTESWAASLEHAVGRGVHIAPGLPYGYAKDDAKRLVPDPDRAGAARRAFEMRGREGLPYPQIAEWLNARAPTRADGHQWAAGSVQRMLRRRVYLGVAHWGEFENTAAHEPLVSAELWEAAQRPVAAYRPPREGDDVALLHQVVRCAGCRFTMSRALNRSGDRERFYYRCRVHRVSGRCEAPAAVRADGDAGLEEYVERLVDAELDRRAAQLLGSQNTDELATAIAEHQAAAADVEALRQDVTARRRLGTRWLEFLEPYLQAEEDAGARVARLRAVHSSPVVGLTSHAYRERSRRERAAILRSMIDVVFVRSTGGTRGRHAVPLGGDRVHVLWRGAGPDDLPAANAASAVVPWPWPERER